MTAGEPPAVRCCELCGHAGLDVGLIVLPGGPQTRCLDWLACWGRFTATRRDTTENTRSTQRV